MIIYSTFGGLDYLGDKVSFYADVSFGNMGFSGAICGKHVLDLEHNG